MRATRGAGFSRFEVWVVSDEGERERLDGFGVPEQQGHHLRRVRDRLDARQSGPGLTEIHDAHTGTATDRVHYPGAPDYGQHAHERGRPAVETDHAPERQALEERLVAWGWRFLGWDSGMHGWVFRKDGPFSVTRIRHEDTALDALRAHLHEHERGHDPEAEQ
jgi:hypothetical protein